MWQAVPKVQAAMRIETIDQGACDATRGLRLLSRDECRRFAAEQKHEYIGSNTEPTEYPGCILWSAQHVEFNEGGTERHGCALPKGSCVCAPTI